MEFFDTLAGLSTRWLGPEWGPPAWTLASELSARFAPVPWTPLVPSSASELPRTAESTAAVGATVIEPA